MEAKGTFQVNLDPQDDTTAPAGRMLIHKEYTGDLIGIGIGQMLSKRTAAGVAVYSAIEEFEGTLAGKKGCFTLVHSGFMSASEQRLDISIIAGSGKGELEGIEGALNIIQQDDKHCYKLEYTV